MKVYNYFYLEESPLSPGKYTIRLDFSLLPIYTTSSYNVLMARVMGLSWAEFLRYCRDEVGADVWGRGCLYPVPYFANTPEVRKLVITLNTRLSEIIGRMDKCI